MKLNILISLILALGILNGCGKTPQPKAATEKAAREEAKKKAEQKHPPHQGFISWLRGQGVAGTFENAVGTNKTSAKSVYSFESLNAASKFKTDFLSDSSQYGEIFFDHRLGKYVVPINEKAQDYLKSLYLQKHPLNRLNDIKNQLALIKKARKKIQDFNASEIIDLTKISRANYTKVSDRIARTAELLRNGDEDEGWYVHAAASSMDLLLSLYLATHYHLMSDTERKVIEKVQPMILEVDTKGKFIGGLKADANFVMYVIEQYSAENKKNLRRDLIREDAHLVLNGGQRKIIDRKTPSALTSIIAQSDDPRAFRQKRFFPDENGFSEADVIVLQAGGMQAHSSMRILSKVKDATAPGGFRYFYTKIDAGAGAENVNYANWTGHGIFATEITPYFAIKQLGNGVYSIDTDPNTDKPLALDEAERNRINTDSALYRRHMLATIFALIDAERQILFYKSPKIAVSHGEGKGLTQEDIFEWNFWNNKIVALRGKPVPAMHKITPLQQTGNCAVFSALLTVLSLVGEDLGYDMLQTFKRYTGPIALGDIKAVEEQLLAAKVALLKGSE